MKPKFYAVLNQAIEEGVARGVNRAFKSTDNPTRELIRSEVERNVNDAIHEWFYFDEEELK